MVGQIISHNRIVENLDGRCGDGASPVQGAQLGIVSIASASYSRASA
jgi:hypothetical protein